MESNVPPSFFDGSQEENLEVEIQKTLILGMTLGY